MLDPNERSLLALVALLVFGAPCCTPRESTVAGGTSVLPRVAPTDASVDASAGAVALGGDPTLPPLPAASVTTFTKYVPPLASPPSPCPAETGWDGHACVATTCSGGRTFKRGAGCISCLDECGENPEWGERRPWSNDPTPFDRSAASDGLARADLSSCRRSDGPTGFGHVTVSFLPTGVVDRVVIDGPPFDGTPVGECIIKAFKNVRVPRYGGGLVTVGKSFTLR